MKTQTLLNALLLSSALCFSVYADTISLSDSSVKQWKADIASAFDSAEKEVYVVTPKPDDTVRPDPDAKKCPCKGSGFITHGDGHKTQCPFHGKSSKTDDCVDGSCSPTQTKTKSSFTCQCETKCGCKVCRCAKLEIK